MRYPVLVAQLTDIGLERKENQDAVNCVYDERSDTHLLLVADGMGGAACGSRASQLAVTIIEEKFFDAAGRSLPIDQRINRALIAANHSIWSEAQSGASGLAAGMLNCRGMGATCVLLALLEDNAWVAHVGDSRVYQVSPHRIVRLTRDHSHVQRLVDGGLISEEEAQTHPDRSRIERALGPREIVRPELRPDSIPLVEGDSFVLCTDGLSSLVHDEEIFGNDNITVAIARIGDEVTRAF
jgi:PPM family protein phosphatase